MQSMAWSLLMLLAVIAMIPCVLWVLKRLQTIRPPGTSRQLELLEQLPVGTRERVMLVRVQGRVLVLGATAQQISLLAEATPFTAAPSAPLAAAPTFASLLAGFQSRGTKNKP